MGFFDKFLNRNIEPEHVLKIEPTITNIGMDDWLDVFGVNTSLTPVKALQHSAVFACVRVMSQMIASCPIQIINKTDQAAQVGHELEYMFDLCPNDLVSAPDFWEQILRDMLLEGNGFILLVRSKSGVVKSLERYAPASVEVKYSDRYKKKLIYKLTERGGNYRYVDQIDIIHLRYIGCNNYMGVTPIDSVGGTISAGITENEFSDKYYTKGGTLGYVAYYPDKVDPNAKKQFRDEFKESHSGVDGQHSIAVVDQGGKLEAMTLNANDAQTLEARKYRIIDICRIFGVPPFMIGENEKQTSFGKGVAEQFKFFVSTTVSPLLIKIQAAVNIRVFGKDSDYRIRFNLNELLKGDIEAQAAYFTAALGGQDKPAWMTPNEVRKAVKLPKNDDDRGNELYRSANDNLTNKGLDDEK